MRILICLIFFLSLTSYSKENIIGEWQTNCIPFGQNERHGFIAVAFVEDSMISIHFKMFTDNQCSQHNISIEYDGTYTKFLDEIDHLPRKVDMIIYDQETLDYYNRSQGCGILNWKLQQKRNVSGRFCRPFQMPTNGKKIFDRYFVKDDQLQFGLIPLEWVGDAPQDRPIKPSEVNFFRIY